jgi:hypothetical protein
VVYDLESGLKILSVAKDLNLFLTSSFRLERDRIMVLVNGNKLVCAMFWK